MKPLARTIITAAMLGLASCPAVIAAKEKTEINQPLDEEIYTSVGDRIARVTIKEPLPNAFGGSDLFGRNRVVS